MAISRLIRPTSACHLRNEEHRLLHRRGIVNENPLLVLRGLVANVVKLAKGGDSLPTEVVLSGFRLNGHEN